MVHLAFPLTPVPPPSLPAIILFSDPRSLALAVQLYLKMDRADLAEKALKAMTSQDDESALTQLCTALVYLAQVRRKELEFEMSGVRGAYLVELRLNGCARE